MVRLTGVASGSSVIRAIRAYLPERMGHPRRVTRAQSSDGEAALDERAARTVSEVANGAAVQ
jgi:hypothetical protein